VQPCDEDDQFFIFFILPSNGAPVEWNCQRKTEVLGEKPVPVSLCPPQIPHRLTRDRTRASAVRGRQLTAWAMARSKNILEYNSVNFRDFSFSQWRCCRYKPPGMLGRVHCYRLQLPTYRRIVMSPHVGLVEPEDEGTRILQDVSNYWLHDTT
jgi:hypothetical protein